MGVRVTVKSVLIGINALVLCFTVYIALFHGKYQIALVGLAVNILNIAYIHLAFKTRNDYLKIFGFVTLLYLLHRIPFFVDPLLTITPLDRRQDHGTELLAARRRPGCVTYPPRR